MFLMSVVNYSELTYETSWGTYVYPGWAVAVGWTFASLALLITPFFALYKIVQYRLFLVKVSCTLFNMHEKTKFYHLTFMY